MALTTGPVFTRLQQQLGNKQIEGGLLDMCNSTVDRLLAQQTQNNRPGMLLGRIQSGKTKAFIGVLALAFDNGYDHAVIFTKGTKALARQTLARLRKDLKRATDAELVSIYDVMSLPESLTDWDLQQKLVLVCKKEDDNLEALTDTLLEEYPELADKRILLIDDEADLASVGFRRKNKAIQVNVIPEQMSDLRDGLTHVSYLLVTATPYALYLQPETIQLQPDQKVFQPMFPMFTELVPTGPGYVGGDVYFDQSQIPDTVPSFFHVEVDEHELEVLRKPDHEDLEVDECLATDEIEALRRAIVTFIVGGDIRRWQQTQAGEEIKRYSFIFHTETKNVAHNWQHLIATTLINHLKQAALPAHIATITPLITEAYNDLTHSVAAAGTVMPPLDTVIQRFSAAVNATTIEKVNKDKQLDQLLDESGQLMLRNPLNIFIGGNILDRGITIENVIGFYYGRNPKKSQQDTVLQHARMYGYRAPGDLAVTRFYTTAGIYARMDMIHQFDCALRAAFEAGGHNNGVVFIQKDQANEVIPCSPNKILLSRITALRAGGRLIPVGFSTTANVAAVVGQIDALLQAVNPAPDTITYTLPLATAEQIVDLISQSLAMDGESDFDFHAMKAAMGYVAASNPNVGQQNQVACLVRRGRQDRKRRNDGRLQNAPEGAADHAAVDAIRGGRPAIYLFREEGQAAHGWAGSVFYWPVLIAPPGMQPVIFSSKANN